MLTHMVIIKDGTHRSCAYNWGVGLGSLSSCFLGSGLIGGVEPAQKVHSGHWAFSVDLRSGGK